jgi:hypothetical protein
MFFNQHIFSSIRSQGSSAELGDCKERSKSNLLIVADPYIYRYRITNRTGMIRAEVV